MERGFADQLAAELASTLDWWAQAGVDSLVAEEPRAWLKAPIDAAPIAMAADAEMPNARTSAPAIEEPLPDQLPLFQEWLRTSPALPYAAPAAPRICPAGDPASDLMILTAMPSADDCAEGKLLSGPAGRLFDRMLAAIGRGRETVYIAGLSCIRPPGGRFDTLGAKRCATIARHHIGLAAPRALLLIGDNCAKAMLGGGVAQMRGRVHDIEAGGRTFRAVATFAPDLLLTQPGAKARAWADLQMLMEILS